MGFQSLAFTLIILLYPEVQRAKTGLEEMRYERTRAVGLRDQANPSVPLRWVEAC